MNEEIQAVLENYGRDPSQLVSILQDIQAQHNWLPREALVDVSAGLGVPLTQVFSVATFFRAFSLVPKGRHMVTVCVGTACHVRGSTRILDRAEQLLGIESGGTTSDLKFSLDKVGCLGCCALGPIMVVDGEYHGHFNASKVQKILKKCE